MKSVRKNTQYILYAALILLPLILSIILFFQMRSVINREIERRADQTSLQFYLQTSSMIRELHAFSSSLANDAEVNRLLRDGSSPDYSKIGFCDYITSKVSNTRNVSRAYVISENYGRVYSNEGCYTYSSIESLLKRNGMISADYDFNQYGIDWNLYNESGYAPFCVTPVLRSSGENQGEILGYIIATLDYRRFLENFHMLDAAVSTVYSDNFYISSVVDTWEKNSVDWNDPVQVSSLVGEPVTCVYRSDSDYNYMVGISNKEYYQPLKIMLWGFGIYFALILIAGLLILWRLLKRKKAESQRHILERNLRYILYGHTKNNKDKAFIADAGLSENLQQSYVVSLFFADIQRRHTSQDIEQTVLQYMQGTGLSCTYYEDLKGPVFVFWSENDSDPLGEQVNRLCHNVTQDLLNQSMFVQIYTSIPVHGVAELENAFHQTYDMYENMGSGDHTKPVVNIRNGSRDLPDQSDSFMRSLQLLLNMLIAGKYDQVPDIVKQIQIKHIDPYNDNIEFSRTRRRTLANILSNGLMESNLSDGDKEQQHKEFRHAMESADLDYVAEKYFGKAASLNSGNAKDSSAYDEAITFIKDNLNDHNLSVSMICESLGISVQRLTRIFHNNNDNDMAVAEYVNLLRVQEAQELLVSRKDLSIAEIADMAGYNNSHSLTRNFRKFTGLTPTEFRELEK